MSEADAAASASDEIDRAQAQMARALDRARAGEDRELAQRVRERGERFARMLAGTIRLTRIHDLNNAAFDQPVSELEDALGALVEMLGMVQVVMVEDQVYVNDIRIRFDMESDVGGALCRTFNSFQVGGLYFHAPLSDAQLRFIIAHLAKDPAPDQPRQAFQELLEAKGMPQVQLQPLFRFRVTGEEVQRVSRDVKAVYAIASGAVGHVWDDLASGRSLNPLPVRKAVTEMVEMDDGSQAREMVFSARDRKTPPVTRHSIQVATLAVMIGRELGLSEGQLSDLGVAACFHDAGYGADEDGFPPPFERHGSGGLRLMLQQRGFHEARILRMLTCIQHHHPYDHSPRPSLFSRIVKIADDYDTLTRWRAGGPMEAPPYALARMYAARGTLYDPVLLQLFVNRIGAFPPGSILELTDGSWVTAISGVRFPRAFDKPMTLRVREADGSRPKQQVRVDLAKSDLRVKRVIKPSG
jgi:HD-GYP domain-containing protein (c-di-GMP phosphodiesterase class II)